MTNGKKQILIVDDVPENLQMLLSTLKSKYAVITATNGEKAIEIAMKEPHPNIILLDIMMPGMDGYEVARRLKDNKQTESIPILFLSVLERAQEKVRAFESGGVDYITKPFEPTEVLARVKTHLELTQMKLHLEEEVKERTAELEHQSNELYNAYLMLGRKEEQYRNLVESMEDYYLFYTHNNEGLFTYVSPSVNGILGYTQGEFLTHYTKYMTDNPVNKKAEEATNMAINGQRHTPYELEVLHKNGTKRWLEVSEHPVYDDNMKVIRVEGIARDISTQKKLESELKEKEDMVIAQSRQAAMGSMISMIAHQWRQPISILSILGSNLKVDVELGEEIKTEELEYITDTIKEQTEYLSQTIDDFKNFLKPTQEKQLTTVAGVFESTMKIIGKNLVNHNITVNIDNRSDTELMTYPNQILQVFLNIFSNAKDALRDKKDLEAKIITVTIEERDDSIITTICNNGGPIPEDVIKHIGEPYFTTKEKTGTGLGIHMSKTIVAKHLKGALTWENRDDGACFIVTMPK